MFQEAEIKKETLLQPGRKMVLQLRNGPSSIKMKQTN